MSDMLEKVKETIRQYDMIRSGDSVLVALSGGADSVCLLDCLLSLGKELAFSVSAAHVNHCLRGKDADDDERFVRDLCAKRGVSLYVLRVDVRSEAKETKTGIEEAGRNVRYRYFQELSKKNGVNVIATAHHANDNVETVLMRLIRGTGPLGLGGIPYKNKNIIRPLLDVSRQEIEVYLNDRGLSFRTDASNFETNYTRNRVRGELIPMIESQFYSGFSQTFSEKIRLYSACGAYIKEEAEKLFNKLVSAYNPVFCSFSVNALKDENSFLVSTMLYIALIERFSVSELSERNINMVMDIVRKSSGTVELPGKVLAEICGDILFLRKKTEEVSFCYPLVPESDCQVAETGQRISCSWATKLPKKHGPETAYFDSEKLSGKKLFVRSRRTGDVFYPVGMEGRKKLQDYFVDKKVPHFLRNSVPIITADDEILWIAGFRADRRYLPDKDSKSILKLTVHKGEIL